MRSISDALKEMSFFEREERPSLTDVGAPSSAPGVALAFVSNLVHAGRNLWAKRLQTRQQALAVRGY